jgi:hypothetical protein
MPTWGWVVVGVGLAPILLFAVRMLAGVLTPRRISGLVLLKQKLKQNGIDPELIGEDFLAERVSEAELVSEYARRPGEWKVNSFADAIEGIATSIVLTLRGDPLWARPGERTYDEFVRRGIIRSSR